MRTLQETKSQDKVKKKSKEMDWEELLDETDSYDSRQCGTGIEVSEICSSKERVMSTGDNMNKIDLAEKM